MSTATTIFDLAKKYESYTAENLSKLVKIKSLSNAEKDAVYAAKKMMEEARFDEVRIDGLGNLIGRIGSGSKVLAIDGHIDTVDTGNLDQWELDPFSGEIKDGHVHGRGTVDQKGGIASFITAGRILKETGLENDVTVYFTATILEEDCDGLCWKYIIEEERIKPDLVIITEPTNMRIHRGQRGRMEMAVEFLGLSAHGSVPERGRNAIYMASRAALQIEQLNEFLKVDKFLGKGSIAVTEMKTESPSLCAVADYARLHLDRRLTSGEDKDLATSEIKKLIKEDNGAVHVLNYNIKSFTGCEYGMMKYYPTWLMEEEHQVIQRGVSVYTDLFGQLPVIDKWAFSTNGVTINGYHRIPIIGFGPGDDLTAHAPNEKTPIDQLVKASAFYALYASRY
jgi:putative selenium metabolism hydrolase